MTTCRAFSIVEVLIAVTVIALALLPIISLMTSSSKDVRSTMEEIIASNLASELLETLQSLPVSVLPLGHDGEIETGTFAAAEAAGYKTQLASCPAGVMRHLKIDLLSIDSTIPTDCAADVKTLAASAAAVIEMKVEIRWKKQGRDHKLCLITSRGRY